MRYSIGNDDVEHRELRQKNKSKVIKGLKPTKSNCTDKPQKTTKVKTEPQKAKKIKQK